MGACCSQQVEDVGVDDNKRKIIVFYDDMEQPIIFYKGTSTKDIENVIKKAFKLPLNWSVDFLDDSGVPVVLSDSIPNNTKLFMQTTKAYDSDGAQKIVTTNRNSNNNDDNDHNNDYNDNNSGNDENIISQDMRCWDKSNCLRMIINNDKYSVSTNNKLDWPFYCTTINGITKFGYIYHYRINFDGNNSEFWYVYHHCGMIFKNEIGSLKTPTSFRPSFRISRNLSKMHRKLDIIVDLSNNNNNNNSNTQQNGIYFILHPENRCIAFSPWLNANKPSKKNPLLFGIWTKNKCDATIEHLSIGTKSIIPKSNKIELILRDQTKWNEVYVNQTHGQSTTDIQNWN